MRKALLLVTFTYIMLCSPHFAEAQFTKLVVSLTGSVFDEVTRKPISVKMIAFDENGKSVYRGKSDSLNKGYYFMTGLKPGQKYVVKFNDFKYFRQNHTIEIPMTDKYAEFSHDFLVKPKRKGVQLMIAVPPFELNKSKVRVGAEMFLEDIVKTIKQNRRFKFEIVCHPDNDYDQVINRSLTKDRCLSLKEFLMSQGIKEDRMTLRFETNTDTRNPPPRKKRAKGKRYIGSTYLVVKEF